MNILDTKNDSKQLNACTIGICLRQTITQAPSRASKKTCIPLSYRQSVIIIKCEQPELLQFMRLLIEYLKFHQSKAISSAALSYLYKKR